MSSHDCKKTSSGFSLVELSIVLVILGLLVGGVLGGQSLIRAAELRKISSEYNEIQLAVNAFRLKFDALPGDLSKATDIWGGTDCGALLTQMFAGPVTTTCDGEGNGIINSATNIIELDTHFQHLSLAGLIRQQLNMHMDISIFGTHAYYEHIRPRSSRNGVFWLVGLHNAHGQHHFLRLLNPNIDGNIIEFLDPTTTNGILTPTEAWNIDSKMDDGKPATGIVMSPSTETPASSARKAVTPNCTVKPSSGNPAVPGDMDAEYRVAYESPACVLIFAYP